MINPILSLANEWQKNLLEFCAQLLTNNIVNADEILHLKIANAELLARNWDILNSRNKLRTFFDNIPTSVYIIDQFYSIIAVNLQRSSRVRQTPNLLVGAKCYEKLHLRTSPCPACRVMDTITHGIKTQRNQREWINAETFIDWDISTLPVQEKPNEETWAIIFEEDVTEKKALEMSLIQSEKLAAVGQLAAGVAHEINNPLAAVIANTQLLKRDLADADEDILDSIKLIETAGVRASQVVSNLLGIAHKDKRSEFERLSLNDTILVALSLVNHEIIKHSVTVELNFEDGLPSIVASKNQLQGVWINLIMNSVGAFNPQARKNFNHHPLYQQRVSCYFYRQR